MPKAIPAGILAEHVLAAAKRLSVNPASAFGDPTGYLAVVNGQSYPPKALIGLAAEAAFGNALAPEDFSGGEAVGQANWYLRQLGFEVRSIQPAVGEDWSDDEILVTVDAYFQMLALQLKGEPYVKAERMRAVASRTRGRSVKSVEYKCQNISAVLIEMGFPRLDGFAPAANYQRRLAEVVEDFLASAPAGLKSVLDAMKAVPAPPPMPITRDSITEQPPPPPSPGPVFTPGTKVVAKKHAPWNCDPANRELGEAGEKFVVSLEKAELQRLGRTDLADRVQWVARDIGDGLGYDVLSFAPDGSEIHIEVKTTNGGKDTAFYVTSNEVAYSCQQSGRFRLYRLFNFSRSPRLFILAGDLRDCLSLEPTEYRARVGTLAAPTNIQ